jgi:hypothetical protein
MSTTGLTSWAVDLADIGAIYPFQGAETLMVVICVVFWLGWHVLSTRKEQAHNRELVRKYGNAEAMKRGIDRG